MDNIDSYDGNSVMNSTTINSQETRHVPRTPDDFTTEIRTKLCGFAVTPTEAKRIKREASARHLSISCLIREALRQTGII